MGSNIDLNSQEVTQKTDKVVVPNMIVLSSSYGEVEIDATYDLSNVPNSLRGIVVKAIKQQGMKINL